MKQVEGRRARRFWIATLVVLIAGATLANVWTSLVQAGPRAAMEGVEERVPQKTGPSHSRSSTIQTVAPASVSILVSHGSDKPQSTKEGGRPPSAKASVSVSLHLVPLPNVQAWPDRGDVKPPKSRPPTDRKLIETIEDLVAVQSHLQILVENVTLIESNPVQPSMKDLSNPLSLLNVEIPLEYSLEAPVTSTIPWSNETTMAFYEGRFRSGFRNQIMAFMVLVFESQSEKSKEDGTRRQRHGQILLRSLGQKDTYGSNSFIPFANLWDVAHWNSHYPRLPRLVDYDPILHSQFNFDNTRWFRTPKFVNESTPLPHGVVEPANNFFGSYGLFASAMPMRPYAFGYQHKMMAAYTFYGKGKGRYIGDKASGHARNPVEILMLQGAMRPHPELQAILDGLLQKSSLLQIGESTATAGTISAPLQLEYMTLHARVEPDMQKHKMCPELKVINLTNIFAFIEEKWKEPPVSRIFMPINRQYLELEGDIDGTLANSANDTMQLTAKEKNEKLGRNKINWIAVENLKALNRARDEGLWGGRVKVLEFGARALQGTSYAKKPSTAGAMLNFFIGVPAKIFIGTEVSSFSHDILATRFFRGYHENYKYFPGGLVDWTPPGTNDPPGFQC